MKKMITLLLSATVAASCLIGFAGCGDKQQTADVDSEIYAVYLASGSELSYDEWYAELLKNAKGDKGDKGDPGEDGVGIKSVTLNENGELVLEFTDGNKKNLGEVVGEAGHNGVGIESVEIDDDGNLVVTLTDDTTENLGKVVGESGASGKGITKAEYKEGKLVVTYTDGTSDEIDLEIPQPHVHTWSDWSTVEEATCSSVGISKRTCEDESCDSEEYKLEKQLAHTYGDTPTAVVPATCTEGGVKIYVCSECGNVKGEATEPNGHQYDESGTCTVCGADKSVKKNYGKVSITANESYTLDLSGIEAGTYSVVAKAEGEAVANTLLVSTNHAGNSATYTYDMYMPVSKTYQSVLFLKDNKDTTSVKNNSEETIEVELSVVDYKAPTIKLGEEVEVPCVVAADGSASVLIDSSIAVDGSTKYKVTASNSSYTGVMITIASPTNSNVAALMKTMSYTNSSVTIPAETSELYFKSMLAPGAGTSAMNISIKFESV